MWGRVVNVAVTAKDGSVNLNFDKHRIDFEYHANLGFAADYCSITIYNLESSEIQSLQRRDHGILSVQLNAGYEDQSGLTDYLTQGTVVPSTIFVGSITNVITYNQIPQSVVHLFCIPNMTNFLTRVWPNGELRVEPGNDATLDTIVSLLVSQIAKDQVGYSAKWYGVSDDVRFKKYPKGYSFHKTFAEDLHDLCASNNLTYYARDGYIAFYPELQGTTDAADNISKTETTIVVQPQDIIGTPVAGVSVIEASMILDATITPGMVLDVTNLMPQTSGDTGYVNFVSYQGGYSESITDNLLFLGMRNHYLIKSLVHRGSTHDDYFQTDIHGSFGRDSSMGDLETSWKSWAIMMFGNVDKHFYVQGD